MHDALRRRLMTSTIACFVMVLAAGNSHRTDPGRIIQLASADTSCATIGLTPAGDQPRISAQARAWIGCYDGNFGAPCAEACVATVNHVVHKALSKWLGNDPAVNNTDVLRANGDVTALLTQISALPGDFMIVDSADGKNAHIGVCLDLGCTDVISNGSSTCRFVFRSSHNARFAYPGSPYNGGIARYYRAVTKRSTGGPVAPVHNAFGDLSPLPTYVTPALAVVKAACLTKNSDMVLGRWVYAKGHLLCTTSDKFTGGQQFYTEVSPGKFLLSNAGGGTFSADDLVNQSAAVSHNALARRPIDRATAEAMLRSVSAP